MKKLITILLGFGIKYVAGALRTSGTTPSNLPATAAFNARRLQLNQRGMAVLGTWAVGNIVSGFALRKGTTDDSERYFHEMNAYWNVVNLALAGASLWQGRRAPVALSLTQTVQKHYNIRQLLLFNAGLDVGYMAAGAYLKERGQRPEKSAAAKWIGYGQSILLQGAFLFVFDLVLFGAHQRHGRQALPPLLGSARR